ncbi:MAG: hypothetical protein RL758_693 [Pseudomonadota bacterium]|jgi:uncharacterized MAPEG superfamily protein
MPLPRFTIAYWCIFFVVILPYLCTLLAKFGGRAQFGGKYDNANPRQWLTRLTGWPARANAAQANSFEAVPFFIAAVLIAQQMKALQGTLDMMCVLFVVLRLLYILLYIANVSSLRSMVWFMAFAVNVSIFFSGF